MRIDTSKNGSFDANGVRFRVSGFFQGRNSVPLRLCELLLKGFIVVL